MAIVGAGGIGFDVAEFLTVEPIATECFQSWLDEWGVTDPELHQAGRAPDRANPAHGRRQVSLFQRKDERPGKRLGRTTGWIHRTSLRMKGVRMEGGVTFEKVDSEGLHITRRDGEREIVPADTAVPCTGQQIDRALADALMARRCVAAWHWTRRFGVRAGRQAGNRSGRASGGPPLGRLKNSAEELLLVLFWCREVRSHDRRSNPTRGTSEGDAHELRPAERAGGVETVAIAVRSPVAGLEPVGSRGRVEWLAEPGQPSIQYALDWPHRRP